MSEISETILTPLMIAGQVLDGFLPLLAKEETRGLAERVWKFTCSSLTKAFNEKAAPDEEEIISDLVNRIAAAMALHNFIDGITEVRKAALEDKSLREVANIKDLEDLETYLYYAADYLTKTYEEDGKRKFYEVGAIIEATINSHRNSPLIGSNGLIAPKSNMN